MPDERGLGRRDGPPGRTVKPALPCRVAERPDFGEGGLTLIELMIAAALTMAVVGAAVGLATGLQNVYSYELDDAAAQQEALFALDWISRTIAAGAGNPYDIGDPANGAAIDAALSCTGREPGFEIDPDGDGEDDDVRVLSDVVRPNGLLAGDPADCDEEGEDVTIAHDGPAGLPGAITRLDPALDTAPTAMTDDVFTTLGFTYLNAARTATTDPDDIVHVQVSLTVESKARNPYTGRRTRYTYGTEIRVRSR